MPILSPQSDFTDVDFDALRRRLESLITSVFPEWSDFDTAAFGNILLEMYAFVGDVICYYLDNQARESRLVTATQRKNIIALARMFGYRLHGAVAATAEVGLSLKSPPVADVSIPAGTMVRTKEISDVFNTIRDTDGVRKIGDKHGDLKLNGLPSDVDLQLHEFPTLGPSVTLINGDTGAII